jgi:carbamoyl-phosphate synthase large subunit
MLSIYENHSRNKLLLDHYLDGAIEARLMQFARKMYIIGIMEHTNLVECTPGDSNAPLPPFNLGNL